MNSDKRILYVSRTQEYKSRIFATTTAEVYHLETDNENHRNIIYTDYSALKTTDGQSITTIAGNSLKWGYKEGVGDEAVFTAKLDLHRFLSIVLSQLNV